MKNLYTFTFHYSGKLVRIHFKAKAFLALVHKPKAYRRMPRRLGDKPPYLLNHNI